MKQLDEIDNMTDFFEEFFEAKRFDFDLEKKQFIEHMDYLKEMSVQELTLYKKHEEVQEYLKQINKSQVTKAKIWTPSNLKDKDQTLSELSLIEPEIKFVSAEDKRAVEDWYMVRIFCHSMSFDQNPGRFLRYTIYDRTTEKILGIASIGSDVVSIQCRDKWIGWSHKERLASGRLNNSAIGTCIMATQPFGYNFLGGKLAASLLCTKEVSKSWEDTYQNKLVGLTTTSLYGTSSMYNSIPYWKKLGASQGKIAIKPDDKFYNKWHQFLKGKYPELYLKTITSSHDGPVTGVKQKIMSMMFKEMGISSSKYAHGFERGVYYAPLYENTREFLRGEIEDKDLIPLVKLSSDRNGIVDWWRSKAIRRYEKLLSEDRLNPQVLYYNRGIGMEWDKFKKLYLGDLGR
jgi:hypothetical protein